MNAATAKKAKWFALTIGLYVPLFFLSGVIADNQGGAGLVSLLFLPAFIRLLSFLLIGFWSVPALFIANMIVIGLGGYDLGPGTAAETLLALMSAIGPALGAAVTCAACRLEPNLANLNGKRLLLLSLGASAGNAIALGLGHYALGTPGLHLGVPLIIMFGDALGTWAVIYLLKGLLTFAGMTLRPRD